MSDEKRSEYEYAVPVRSIDSDHIHYYRKLQTHRSWVLEGIRAIAFRNMDYTVKDRPELEAKGYTGEKYQVELENEMLKEQGLDRTSSNRAILQQALWIPWEVYACLLYAEIECYKRISRKVPDLAYEPLEQLLALNPKLIQSLKESRDLLLHPLKKPDVLINFLEFAELTDQMGHDFRVVLRDLQIIIDDYLHWLRAGLMESLFGEMENFSVDQSIRLIDTHTETMRRMIADEVPGIDPGQYEQGIAEGLDLRESLLPYRHLDYPTTSRSRGQYNRWQQRFAMLGDPLPERPYYANPTQVWVPRPEDLFKPASDVSTEQQLPAIDESHDPPSDKKNLGCMVLVMRAIMLLNLNETPSFVPSLVEDMSQSSSILDSLENYNPACRFVSPFVVSLALLVEPIRLYQEATNDRHKLRQQKIEELIGGNSYRSLLRFRNVIFHVPDERIDFHKATLSLFENLQPGSNREIILGLQDFYSDSLSFDTL